MAKPSLLDETTHFVRLFLHQCGTSEIPKDFNLWTCISLIAACVADRVWLEKFRGKKLTPNLYIALIGPSAVGKGEAIDTALRFVQENPRVNVYAGKASAQHLVARMGRPRKTDEGGFVLENSKLFLVTPELSMSVGKGEQADSFIKHMTELYTGRDYPLRDGTVTRGEVILRNHCINWLAGTTKEWLMDSVPREAISGGFFGRMVAVEGHYDLEHRMTRPVYPDDYEAVVDHLRQRIELLCHLEGPAEMTGEAREAEEQWYMNRPAPNDDTLIPAWKREHDLMLKLAIILCLADGGDLKITRRHVTNAQELSARVQRSMPGLIAFAATTSETAAIQIVAEQIRKLNPIQHSTLARWAWHRGIAAERLREVIETLVQSKQVKRVGTTKGMVYTWASRRRIPAETNGEGDDS